ncbi:MAG: hypothetical protein AMXMBFR47_39430 [Planctomycetota bacterium]
MDSFTCGRVSGMPLRPPYKLGNRFYREMPVNLVAPDLAGRITNAAIRSRIRPFNPGIQAKLELRRHTCPAPEQFARVRRYDVPDPPDPFTASFRVARFLAARF